MKADELLFWISARREGSWSQFRKAVESLHATQLDLEEAETMFTGEGELSLHQRLRLNLDCLGHVEFFAHGCEAGWRVAPPTLAVHPLDGGVRGCLCGARSPALIERFGQTGADLQCEVNVIDGAPQVIRVVASHLSVIQAWARPLRVQVQPDAPLAILSQLPPCEPPPTGHPQTEFPLGEDWRIREFDPQTAGWHKTDRQRAQAGRIGLFEFQLYDRWRYFLRWSGATFEMSRPDAVYVLLRRRSGLLQYEPEHRVLRLPGTCRPPRLIERALVLCSGFPPTFDLATRHLTYRDVPINIARAVAELLRQDL